MLVLMSVSPVVRKVVDVMQVAPDQSSFLLDFYNRNFVHKHLFSTQ